MSRLRTSMSKTIDDSGIGGPPANVARPLIQVTVDDFDHIQRKIGTSLPLMRAQPFNHAIGKIGQLGQRAGEFLIKAARQNKLTIF